MATKLTQEFLRSRLDYDPVTGILTWRPRPMETFKSRRAFLMFHTRFAGKRVGAVHGSGYRYFKIAEHVVLAHRMIWLWVFGYLPDQVDHENHDRDDNRLINLRDVTVAINAQNMSLPSDNTSGRIGIYWQADRSTWVAKIGFGGAKFHLGTYRTKEEAILAREVAESRFGFHTNHGAANDNAPLSIAA